jgi:hypothetical protein
MLVHLDFTRVQIPCIGGGFSVTDVGANASVGHVGSSCAFHDGPKDIATSRTPVTPVTQWKEVLLNDSKGAAQ